MTIIFQELWDAYPTMSRADLFNELGGGWPALTEKGDFVNTCAIRLSHAMNAIGNPPPVDLVAKDGNLKDGQGRGICARVLTASVWLERVLGQSTWGMTKAVGADLTPQLPDWSGILLYQVPGGSDATGHVDLWNRGSCRVDCHIEYAKSATDLKVWKL